MSRNWVIRTNKKVCVFPVSRPSLFIPSNPKTFYCVWVSNHQNLEIDSYVFLLKLVWWLRKWYHVDCMHMSTPVYNALASSSISWQCTACGMPNFSTTLFDSFVIDSSSNSFEHLSNSNISLSPGPPAATSSPIKQSNLHQPGKTATKPKNTKILVVNFQSVKNKKAEIGNLIDSSNPNINHRHRDLVAQWYI